MIIDKIKDSLKVAMKNSEKEKVLAIRNILEKIKKIEVDSQKELNENEIIKIISKYAKQLRDSITQFKAGNRLDLVEKEEQELKIVEEFLPQQLSNEEIDEIAKNVINDLNAKTMSDMGIVMKKIMEITKETADGSLISAAVKKYLT
ncbi:GatB/YqeY domain-containing protein [bacterium]|nr:GatB/YqeY domain-containing protein [bacterium]